MRKIRVLVVDDAVVVRQIVSSVLTEDPQIQVVGLAQNGRVAITKARQLEPDVVILDVEMPEMDGLETVSALRRDHPHLPVIMFSTLTDHGAVVTLEALARGATDYATKPSNVGSLDVARQRIRDDLVPRVKILSGRGITTPSASLMTPPTASRPQRESSGAPADVVVIGVSTGGPNALAVLLSDLPGDLPVPLLIVQHMPPIFTKLLAERLSTKTPIKVREGVHGDQLRPGYAWIAPGNYHMAVWRDGGAIRLHMNQGPPENSCRPSVDVMFRSVAEVFGPRTLAIVMTGMGQDGFRGCGAIREAGGQILVQDEATSVVWGMPGAVANARLADKVLPLQQLAPEILRRLLDGRTKKRAVPTQTQA